MACGTILQNTAQPSETYVEHDPWCTHPSSSTSSAYRHTSSGYIQPSSSPAQAHTYIASLSPPSLPSSSTRMPTSSACIQSSSSSIDWSDARTSFSRDFARPGAHSGPHESMKEISEISESPARVSSSKSSPSEFEFSMSIPDSSYEHTMLAADELFYDGKLLPLYNTSQQDAPIQECITTRRRSSAEEYATYAHSDHVSELGKVKVEHNPISPKAPTCTSRWRELLGLKKVQVQDISNGGKFHRKSPYLGNGLAPGRRSVDSLKDPKVGRLSHAEPPLHCFVKEPKTNLSHGDGRTHYSVKEMKPALSHGEARIHAVQVQNHANGTHVSSVAKQSDLSVADPELCPTTNLQTWQMDRGTSGSRSSKSSEDSEGPLIEAGQMQGNCGGQGTTVKQRNRAKSPTKQIEQARVNSAVMSPRRGGGGPKGMSPVRPSGGIRQTESSRSAIATRLVVRGLDRSYSNPKPIKKRAEQLRSGRQRTSSERSRSLERSTSYPAGVRVTPVINVPMYITPGLRKGSRNGIFGLTQLFSSKKDKTINKLSSSAAHHHHARGDG